MHTAVVNLQTMSSSEERDCQYNPMLEFRS